MAMTFEKLPKETTKAFAAFKAYLDMGPQRSLLKTPALINCKKGRVEWLSRKYDWPARVVARDVHVAELERLAIERLNMQSDSGCRSAMRLESGRWWWGHIVPVDSRLMRVESRKTRPLVLAELQRFVAGADVFSRQGDGTTMAQQYERQGIRLRPANMDRLNGWAELMQGWGDPENGIRPTIFVHARCWRLIEMLPTLQHDSNWPEDVLKVDAGEEGVGGDDAADALRYLVATKTHSVLTRKLRGL